MRCVIFLIVLFCANISFGLNFREICIDIPTDSIFYKVESNLKSNEIIVFLHCGLCGSIPDFEDYAESVSNECKIISTSTKGDSNSDIGLKPFTYEFLANDVAGILNQEKIDKAVEIEITDDTIMAYNFATSYSEKQKNRRKIKPLLSRIRELHKY